MDEISTTPKPRSMTITACPGRVEALFHGHIIADSGQARLVREEGQPDTYYFPREDVEMSKLARTDLVTHSPTLGEACHWTLLRDGKFLENGVWSYENPSAEAEDLRGLVAFRPDAIEIHFVEHDPDRMWTQEDKIGEYIRHTDSGSGLSQERRWEPNVSQPDDESGELDEDDPRVGL